MTTGDIQNYGKLLPDGFIEAIYDTGKEEGLERKELVELHIANMRGDREALLKSLERISSVVVSGNGFHSPHSTGYSSLSDYEAARHLAFKARSEVEAWIESKAPESVKKAFQFDQAVRAYLTRNEIADFTLDEPKETLEQLIAQGLEVIEELP